MVTYANIEPGPFTDGVSYSSSKVMPAAESDLYTVDTPVPVLYGQAILAIITLTSSGGPDTNSSYVVLQTDLGDGVWIDVAGILWTGTQGQAIFAISAGIAGPAAAQKTRTIGTAPAANFANNLPLGGRIRFVGKSTLAQNGSSSSSASGALQVTADIRYKILALR